MYSSHTIPMPLYDWGRKTVVMWAKRKPSKAVIFIHGFAGRALKTWSHFQKYFDDHKEFDNCDIFFYGYDSLGIQACNSALAFYHFLHKIHSDPSSLAVAIENVEPLRTGAVIQYSQVRIVAHSLGAIIARLALNSAFDQKNQWVTATKMILFAPAHHGARVIPLLVEAFFPSVLKPLALLARYKIVTLDDLREGSITIRELKDKTQAIQQSSDGAFSKASLVVWADREKVVFNNKFCDDPLAIQFNSGTSHTNVCSPTSFFRKPIMEVAKHIQST